MVNRTRPLSVLLAGALLVAAWSGPARGQAQIEPSSPEPVGTAGPGLAEVALCQMPELGEKAASLRPLVASIAGSVAAGPRTAQVDGAAMPTGSRGCMLPSVEVPDALDSGAPISMYALNDLVGDAPVDVLRVLSTERQLSGAEATARRKDRGTVIAGKPAKAIPAGGVFLIGVELEAPLEAGDSVVVGTDVKGSATRRAPAGVARPRDAFANLRDLYHVAVRDDGTLFAASTDLSTGQFYAGKRPFAAWLDGMSAYFVIPRIGLGDDFRVATFRPGEQSDSAGLGAEPGLIPSDGMGDWIDRCIHQLLVHERLELEDITFPSYDEVTFCFGTSEEDLELLEEWLDDVSDSDGVARGKIGFGLFEQGKSRFQEAPLDVWIGDDGGVYFSFLIGLSAFDFHAITDVEILPTGSAELDELLASAARTIARRVNPTFVDATAGSMQGSECVGATPRPVA